MITSWLKFLLIQLHTFCGLCISSQKCVFSVFLVKNLHLSHYVRYVKEFTFLFSFTEFIISIFVDSNAYMLRIAHAKSKSCILVIFWLKKCYFFPGCIGYAKIFTFVYGWIKVLDFNSGWCKCLTIEYTVLWVKHIFLGLLMKKRIFQVSNYLCPSFKTLNMYALASFRIGIMRSTKSHKNSRNISCIP